MSKFDNQQPDWSDYIKKKQKRKPLSFPHSQFVSL